MPGGRLAGAIGDVGRVAREGGKRGCLGDAGLAAVQQRAEPEARDRQRGGTGRREAQEPAARLGRGPRPGRG
jgi:hypothetical protein